MSENTIRLSSLFRYVRSTRERDVAFQMLEARGYKIDLNDKFGFDKYKLSQDDVDCILEKLSPSSEILRDFLEHISVLTKSVNLLGIRVAEMFPPWFPKSEDRKPYSLLTVNGLDWVEHIPDDRFDLIFCDFPLNAGICKTGVLHSLSYLSDGGIAFCMLEPSAMSGMKGNKFKDNLSDKGFYINAVFNTPDDLLIGISVRPIIVAISNKSTDNLFISELNSSNQAKDIAERLISNTGADYINQGMIVPSENFDNFPVFEAKSEIEKIETIYKDYKQVSLKDLAIEINGVRTGGEFKEIKNSIYIPRIGKSPVVSELSKTTIKHQNYHQVVLNDKALNQYVSTFFRSDIGKLTLDTITFGATIKNITKGNLNNIVIAMPEMHVQKKIAHNIIETENKIIDLQEAIQTFNKEIVLNPISSEQFLHKLDDMLNLIGLLTESDEIKSLIRSGESDTVEFKQTLDLDIKTKQKEKYIQTSALKTIPGFMNNKGGVLLIGVDDDGNINGLETEVTKFHKDSIDNFKLHFKNILRTRVGEKFYPFIDYEVYSVDGKSVLKIDCKQIKEGTGCYLDGADFYVRRNPGTDKLEGQQLAEYTISHFKH